MLRSANILLLQLWREQGQSSTKEKMNKHSFCSKTQLRQRNGLLVLWTGWSSITLCSSASQVSAVNKLNWCLCKAHHAKHLLERPECHKMITFPRKVSNHQVTGFLEGDTPMPADKAILFHMVSLWPCKAAVAGRSTIPSVKVYFSLIRQGLPGTNHQQTINFLSLQPYRQKNGRLAYCHPESLHKSKSHYATFWMLDFSQDGEAQIYNLFCIGN